MNRSIIKCTAFVGESFSVPTLWPYICTKVVACYILGNLINDDDDSNDNATKQKV